MVRSKLVERLNDQAFRRGLLWGVVFASFLLRLLVAGLSEGTNDVRHWRDFADHISRLGLAQTYRDIPFFNHPPLMGLLAALWIEISRASHIPFSVLLKLPVILSELVTIWILWLIWSEKGGLSGPKVAALFGMNLISILVSSYHGNTDCLCAMLCLVCAFALSRERWAWAGLALGAAINVKLVPLMLVPVFMAMLPSWRSAVRFTLALGAGALPFLPIALIAWPEFRRNVLDYNSMAFNWGVPLLAEETLQSLPKISRWLTRDYAPVARYVIMGFMVAIGALWRWQKRFDAFEAGAVALSVMLVLLPGFGIQYLVWPVPLFFAANPRRAASYGAVGGAFALLVYYLYWTGGEPWFSNFLRVWFPPPAHLLGLLAWAMLLGFSVESFRRVLRLPLRP